MIRHTMKKHRVPVGWLCSMAAGVLLLWNTSAMAQDGNRANGSPLVASEMPGEDARPGNVANIPLPVRGGGQERRVEQPRRNDQAANQATQPPANRRTAPEAGRRPRGERAAPANNPGRPGAPQAAGAPRTVRGGPNQVQGAAKGGAAGGSGMSMTGRVAEVSKGMAESLRTRRVDFDSAKARERRNTILLSPRKSNPEDFGDGAPASVGSPL